MIEKNEHLEVFSAKDGNKFAKRYKELMSNTALTVNDIESLVRMRSEQEKNYQEVHKSMSPEEVQSKFTAAINNLVEKFCKPVEDKYNSIKEELRSQLENNTLDNAESSRMADELKKLETAYKQAKELRYNAGTDLDYTHNIVKKLSKIVNPPPTVAESMKAFNTEKVNCTTYHKIVLQKNKGILENALREYESEETNLLEKYEKGKVLISGFKDLDGKIAEIEKVLANEPQNATDTASVPPPLPPNSALTSSLAQPVTKPQTQAATTLQYGLFKLPMELCALKILDRPKAVENQPEVNNDEWGESAAVEENTNTSRPSSPVSPDKMTPEELKSLVDGKPSYVLYNNEVFYVDLNFSVPFRTGTLNPFNLLTVEKIFAAKQTEESMGELAKIIGHKPTGNPIKFADIEKKLKGKNAVILREDDFFHVNFTNKVIRKMNFPRLEKSKIDYIYREATPEETKSIRQAFQSPKKTEQKPNITHEQKLMQEIDSIAVSIETKKRNIKQLNELVKKQQELIEYQNLQVNRVEKIKKESLELTNVKPSFDETLAQQSTLTEPLAPAENVMPPTPPGNGTLQPKAPNETGDLLEGALGQRRRAFQEDDNKPEPEDLKKEDQETATESAVERQRLAVELQEKQRKTIARRVLQKYESVAQQQIALQAEKQGDNNILIVQGKPLDLEQEKAGLKNGYQKLAEVRQSVDKLKYKVKERYEELQVENLNAQNVAPNVTEKPVEPEISEPKPELPQQKVTLKYIGEHKDRYHAFTVQYAGLKGDQAKTKILRQFKNILDGIESKEELQKFRHNVQKSAEYKILATGTGVVTKMLRLETSSLKALKSMIQEKEKHLDSQTGNKLR